MKQYGGETRNRFGGVRTISFLFENTGFPRFMRAIDSKEIASQKTNLPLE